KRRGIRVYADAVPEAAADLDRRTGTDVECRLQQGVVHRRHQRASVQPRGCSIMQRTALHVNGIPSLKVKGRCPPSVVMIARLPVPGFTLNVLPAATRKLPVGPLIKFSWALLPVSSKRP